MSDSTTSVMMGRLILRKLLACSRQHNAEGALLQRELMLLYCVLVRGMYHQRLKDEPFSIRYLQEFQTGPSIFSSVRFQNGFILIKCFRVSTFRLQLLS